MVIVPLGLFIAWKGWIKNFRPALPAWRNGFGLAALVTLSMSWAVAAFLNLSVFTHYEAGAFAGVQWVAFHLAHTVDVAAVLLAIALKGETRIATALAAVLMLTCWPGGYN